MPGSSEAASLPAGRAAPMAWPLVETHPGFSALGKASLAEPLPRRNRSPYGYRLDQVVSVLRDKRVEVALFAATLACATALGAGLAHGDAKYIFAGFAAIVLSIAALTAPRYLSLLAVPALVLVPPTVRIPSLGAGLTPLRVIVVFGIVGWVLNGSRMVRMPIGYRVTGLVFSVYVIFLASTHDLTSVSRGFAYSVESLAIAWLAWRAIENKRDFFKLIDMLTAVMVIAALLAVYETIAGHFLLPADGTFFFHAPLRDGQIRGQGVFPHPLVLGTALAIMLPVAISRGLTATRWHRAFSIGAALLYAFTLVLIEGRGPWIGATCAVVALAALLRGSKRLTIIAGLVLCIIAVAISPLGGNVASLLANVTSNEHGQESVKSVLYRKTLLTASLSYAETHPFGTGPGEEEAANLTGTLETHLNNSIDNAYAKYAVELGPVGLLLFLFIMFTVVLCAWRGRNVRDSELATVATGILAGEIAVLVISATVATFSWQQLAALFWLLVGGSMMIEVLGRSSDRTASVSEARNILPRVAEYR